ncbi:periplasmic chaperone [Mariprofundus micogutta]|uniref:Periplasmic chaperone n=1 Tax=Mariprofundus micogutta TaxID=1921010 RepID=A0A1L8CJY8_9PROT|nr:OmpH family outer membrane protein [Mariprofundus micogutta]GAV19195.1 periplasmic chaperone [Mariprofundus micogutta]
MQKSNYIRSIIASLGAMMICGVTMAHAEGMKFGYVDMKSAVENTADYQMGMKRLKSLQAQKVKELQALGEKISKSEKDLLGQSMAMSPDRLAQKQQALKSMRTDFQRKQQDAQEALSAEKNRLDISIGTKFQKVISSYGKQGKYDIIMQKPAFLYVDPKHDVTADITKLLDAKK